MIHRIGAALLIFCLVGQMPAEGVQEVRALRAENKMLKASVTSLRQKLAGLQRELAALRAENEKLRRAPPTTRPTTQPKETPAAPIGFAELAALARSYLQRPPPERTAAAEAARREAMIAGVRGRKLTMDAVLENVARRAPERGPPWIYEGTLWYRSKRTVKIPPPSFTERSFPGPGRRTGIVPIEEIRIRAWPVDAAAVDLPRGGRIRVSGVIDRVQIAGSSVARRKAYWSVEVTLQAPIVLERIPGK